MRQISRLGHVLACGLLMCAPLGAADLAVNGKTAVTAQLSEVITIDVTGAPGAPVTLFVDVDPGPVSFQGSPLPIGFSPFLITVPLGAIPASGTLSLAAPVPGLGGLSGVTVYLLALVQSPGIEFTNGVTLSFGDQRIDLAGNSLAAYPHFEFVRAFNQGSSVELGIDPTRYPYVVGKTVDIYVVAAKSASQWDSNPALVDVTVSGAKTVAMAGGSIQSNIVTLDTGLLMGDAGAEIGVPYDVVIDTNRNGLYDGGDFIDGYGDEAGLYVFDDFVQPGPFAVTETIYSGGNFLGQDLYFPTNIASMGQLPLVVVSHGNGHNYQWYDHIGMHLASYGYVVMSHQNNTQPGTLSASTTTLTNTDYFLGNLATIAGGALNGHIETNWIAWIGHSRGGEGVVRAYHRLTVGSYVPANFGAANIKLVSSIAPTDFGGTIETDPHGVNYHLWTGAADNDVNGCAASDVGQTFHLHDRAQNIRQSTSLYGAGHGDFHDGGGSSVASGPCLIGRPNTHRIIKGYLLPLLEHYHDGNIGAKDYLWRQWESFRPIGAPTTSCASVDLMYRESESSGKYVVEDFQTGNGVSLSSSGGAVTWTVQGFREGVTDDGDGNFTNIGSDIWNSVTLARTSDSSRGGIFNFSADSHLTFEVVDAQKDVSSHAYVSFRMAQASRHPLTTAVLGDLTFDVTLRDELGHSSSINVGVYGGGVEEPYQRTGCGSGVGWAAEFETIRIRLSDFLRDGSQLDLSQLSELAVEVGPSHGSTQARVVFDQVEFTKD